MPLSKERNKARMRQARLHAKVHSEDVQPNIPLYNPATHKPGDTVRVLRGRRELVVTIPKLDADGNAIPDY